MKKLNKNNLIESDSKININNSEGINQEIYIIPDESSCSAEFSKGCIFREW